MKVIEVMRDVEHCQCRGCAWAIQIGTTIYMGLRLFGGKDSPSLFVQIDTPTERLRGNIFGLRFGLKSNNKHGNSYRDRWLRKMGCEVGA